MILKVKTIPREVGNYMLEFKARTNLKLKVTNRQMEIIFGTLLGDGYVHPRGQIQLEQSYKYHQYLNWKYDELKSLAYGSPKQIKRFDKRFNKTYIGVRFWLRQYFRPLRKLFYPEGVKIVPNEISRYFSGLCIAVWYMDDGNFSEGRNLKIATDSFNSESINLLQNLLSTKYGIESTIQASGKLRIASNSLDKFFSIVKPYIHSSMLYKIP